mmetsp:Transcript_41554/g.79589  ORF Transcript_41554/g.79589 Transcript_41554/m.79589 type:complete len:108 (+) Transcript_41554:629-952(+)
MLDDRFGAPPICDQNSRGCHAALQPRHGLLAGQRQKLPPKWLDQMLGKVAAQNPFSRMGLQPLTPNKLPLFVLRRRQCVVASIDETCRAKCRVERFFAMPLGIPGGK